MLCYKYALMYMLCYKVDNGIVEVQNAFFHDKLVKYIKLYWIKYSKVYWMQKLVKIAQVNG